MFAALRHFHPNLIFVVKARSLPCPVTDFIRVEFHSRYKIRVEVTDSDKILLIITVRSNLRLKKFIVQAPGPYLQRFIFFLTSDGPNKLQCMFLASLSRYIVTLAYWAYLLVMNKMKCFEYGPRCQC